MNIQEQFNLVAAEYDGNRRKFIPCYDDYYRSTTDFIARTLAAKPRLIFDLGSGTGLLASFWFPHFPDARYVLVDVAEGMLEVARKRFAGVPNVAFEAADYAERLPQGNPDAIISALSIHHLEHEKKRLLFKAVHGSLANGGVFVNYDQFCSEDASLNEKIERYWTDGIKASGISETEYSRWLERKKLDRECSVLQEIAWLKDAGFKTVDCVYCMGKFGVIIAEK